MNNLPRKMMEYMSFGVAVVASDFEGWRRYVVDTGGGLPVPFGDVGAMADAIKQLLTDPDRLARMGRLAREAVEKELCWEKEQQKLLDFYAWLLRRTENGD
jgi:glycosyltransferase involved in cell wall biosynthesis